MRFVVSLVTLLAACRVGRTPEVSSPTPPVPLSTTVAPSRLVVLVVVDQLGTTHIPRAEDFLEGGLARMLSADAWQGVALHPHAKTETCPGHATLATGVEPATHGIPANRFFVDGQGTYCGDLALLEADSIGDVYRRAGGEVVALSLKDRGALFLGGRSPTLATWVDAAGVFVQRDTATRQEMPVVPALIDREAVRSLMSEPWTPLNPAAVVGMGVPDKTDWEVDHGLGAGFPKRPAAEVLGDQVRTALMYTPLGGTVLTDAAVAAIGRYGLGADDVPDLLTVSYSHFDGIGHAHTPESQESLDALLRLDRDLGRLLSALDDSVGAGQWSLLLTADHGSPPKAPTYVDLRLIPERVQTALESEGLDFQVSGRGHGLWFAPTVSVELAPRVRDVVDTVLSDVEGVEQVVAPRIVSAADPFATAYTAGYFGGRAADIEIRLRAQHVALYGPSGERGTDHGSPRPYDREVPLYALGQGIIAGGGQVDAREVARAMAQLAGLEGPADSSASVPSLVRQ